MKKKKLLFLALCSLIFITACGTSKEEKKEEKKEKVLACTQDMSSELNGLGTWTSELSFTFKDDKMDKTNLKMVINMESDKVTEEHMKAFEESLKSECSLENYSSCDVTRKDKTVTFLASGTAEIAGSDYSDKLTYEEAKEMLEADGFTCK